VGELLGLDLGPINALDAAEIERGIAAVARSSNAGVIVTLGGTGYRRDLIIPLMASHRLPAVYPFCYDVAERRADLLRTRADRSDARAAGYLDRILKGEMPADLFRPQV
jgi:putative tryptophan/tyrosine transport system substrate-binding protein